MRFTFARPKEGRYIEHRFLFIPRILEVCADKGYYLDKKRTGIKEFRWLEYSNVIVDYEYNIYSESKRTVMYWFEEVSSK
jgi:hypothetical protein